MPDMQLLLFASELRTRAQEILVRAANTDDLEAQEMMHEVAASYQKLALQVEQRVRGARKRVAAPRGLRAAARGTSNQTGLADAGAVAPE